MVTQVIINADDFGYSRSVNYGIVDAHVRGVLTSTTMMANMPGFSHAVALKQDLPSLGVGVHLVMDCGRPLLTTHTRLVDADGNFHQQAYYMADDAAAKMDETFVAELKAEWTAQIDAVYEAGIIPTHLDGHHHLFIMFPATRAVTFELARQYGLPIRVDGHRLTSDEVPSGIPHTTFFERRFDEVGFDELRENETGKETYFTTLLEKMRGQETVEIMTHPGYVGKELLEGSSWNVQRAYILDELINSTFAERLKADIDFELITFDALKK